MSGKTLSLAELESLTTRALSVNGTSANNAMQVAAAIVMAEADGLKGHGASRVPFYAAQAKSGKVDGNSTQQDPPFLRCLKTPSSFLQFC